MSANRGQQFYQRYKYYHTSKVILDFTHRSTYNHWNNWCFKGGRGLYCLDKGYDEDYAKYHIRYA